jgi:hypothetical protein
MVRIVEVLNARAKFPPSESAWARRPSPATRTHYRVTAGDRVVAALLAADAPAAWTMPRFLETCD